MNSRWAFVGAGLAILALRAPVAAQTNDYGLNVINDTEATIEYFYFSACRDPNWGEDRLGRTEVIRPGASRFISMHDGIPSCCRDMRVKFDGGQTRQRMGVNVCTEWQWVVK